MRSGNSDTFDGPRACTWADTLPREYRTARASDTTGSSTGLSRGVGNWLFPGDLGVTGSVSNHRGCWGGVDGRTSSMGVDKSSSMPRPTAPMASLRGVPGVPPTSAARCFSARRSSLRRRRSWSALSFFSRRRLSLSMISRSAPASSVSARSSILLERFVCTSSLLLSGRRSLRESFFSPPVLGEERPAA